MQFPDFPPPSLLGELSNETREFRSEEIFAIELADVELSTDPVAVFCQIRISNQDGMTRTVTKSWKDLVSFLAKLCRELGASGIPWDTDDLAAAQDEVFQRKLQRSLDSLLENPELLKRPACIDFFHLGSEYQARRNSRAEGPSQPHPQRERVERLLDDVYEPLRQRHARERCDLERRGHSATSSRAAEWHRQEVYLDEDQLARARAASRQHLLGRHVEWLTGPRPLPDEALRDLVHVQHLLDLDLEDLRLPDGAKRSRDRFSGQSGDVSEQMILDATRSVFVIDRKTFCFSTVFEEHGANPDEAQVLKRLFSEALVESVEQCLGRGGQAPPMLLRAVSTAMSQAGLAHVEYFIPARHRMSTLLQSVNKLHELKVKMIWDSPTFQDDALMAATTTYDAGRDPRNNQPIAYNYMKQRKKRGHIGSNEFKTEKELFDQGIEIPTTKRWQISNRYRGLQCDGIHTDMRARDPLFYDLPCPMGKQKWGQSNYCTWVEPFKAELRPVCPEAYGLDDLVLQSGLYAMCAAHEQPFCYSYTEHIR